GNAVANSKIQQVARTRARGPLTPALSPSEGGEGEDAEDGALCLCSPSPPSEGERVGVRGPFARRLWSFRGAADPAGAGRSRRFTGRFSGDICRKKDTRFSNYGEAA